jgi:anthranilate synthase/aminodeoxychorismate synthase-like glutamine amidotransferase
MSIILIDSYDSFTYNIVQALGTFGANVEVYVSDQHSPDHIASMNPSHLILGPGPGHLQWNDPLCMLVQHMSARCPILGVCLGHQAIGLAFGGKLVRHSPVHGHAEVVDHDGTGLFKDMPPKPQFTRYHSLVLDPMHIPANLRITATSRDDAIMAISHKTLPIFGVQFHPESILSGGHGAQLLHRFSKIKMPEITADALRDGTPDMEIETR